jgi:hypothetical protein
MKTVVQLNQQGYYTGLTVADESPLEPGVYLMPAGTIDAEQPIIPENHFARWVDNNWTFEPMPEIVAAEELAAVEETYVQKRAREYPPMTDYLDGIVKGDQSQIDKYIADCLAVKAKYPKV